MAQSPSQNVTPQAAAAVAKAIASDFYGGSFDLSARDGVPKAAWEGMPEVYCVARLRSTGASPRAVRLFLTFTAAMDRARDATLLWNASAELFTSHSALFEPAKVSKMPLDALRMALADAHVSQRHRPDSAAWRTIATSLAAGDNPVSRAVNDGVGDARELLECLQTKNASHNRFPFLRGPKIGPMWVRLLAEPGGAAIEGIKIVPVAVDVQVRRVTRNLMGIDVSGMSAEKARERVQAAWRDAVAGTTIGGPPEIADTCAALDPALWFFGKYGCSHCEKAGQPITFGRACAHCRLSVSP